LTGPQIAVPAYVPPGDPLAQAITADGSPVSLVVMDNNNGQSPMTGTWLAQADDYRAAGIITLAYCFSWDYAHGQPRPAADVHADILGALVTPDGILHFDGVFVDTTARDAGPGGSGTAWLDYYAALYAWIRQLAGGIDPGRAITVANNPGTAVDDRYPAAPTADIFVTFEGGEDAYTGSYLGGNVFNLGTGQYRPGSDRWPPGTFWHLVYSAASAQSMLADLALAQYRWAGWAYVTDAGLPDPYAALPSWGLGPESPGGWPQQITITPGARAPQNEMTGPPAAQSHVTVPGLTDGIYE